MTCSEINDASSHVMSALGAALDFLGEDSKRVVLFHMAERHGISSGSRISLAEAEKALESLLGAAAPIIIVTMRKLVGVGA
jgi:hypothetical protein